MNKEVILKAIFLLIAITSANVYAESENSDTVNANTGQSETVTSESGDDSDCD